jgi:hypothetical protein
MPSLPLLSVPYQARSSVEASATQGLGSPIEPSDDFASSIKTEGEPQGSDEVWSGDGRRREALESALNRRRGRRGAVTPRSMEV